jgi:hypothetical protein
MEPTHVPNKKIKSSSAQQLKFVGYLDHGIGHRHWNLAASDAYADLLWEKNIIRSLKNTVKAVL